MDPTSARVNEALSEVSKTNKKWLLLSALLGVLFVDVGLAPTDLTIGGTKFTGWDEVQLVYLVLILSTFFLVSFIVTAISDYIKYFMNVYISDTKSDREYERLLQRQVNDELTEQDKILLHRHNLFGWVFRLSDNMAKARVFVESILPCLLCVIALARMTDYLLT